MRYVPSSAPFVTNTVPCHMLDIICSVKSILNFFTFTSCTIHRHCHRFLYCPNNFNNSSSIIISICRWSGAYVVCFVAKTCTEFDELILLVWIAWCTRFLLASASQEVTVVEMFTVAYQPLVRHTCRWKWFVRSRVQACNDSDGWC